MTLQTELGPHGVGMQGFPDGSGGLAIISKRQVKISYIEINSYCK